MHVKLSTLPLLCALLLGAGALLVPRPAQAFCYYDYTYTQTFYGACITQFTQIMNKAEWVQEKITQGEKYLSWVDQVKKQEERFQQLNPGSFNLGELTGSRVKIDDLKERDVNEGVAAMCEKGRSRVADEQMQICRAKQQLINRRYNLMAQMFKDAEKRDKKLQDIRSNRNGISGAKDAGRLAGNTNSNVQLRAGITNDSQNYVMTMELYTSMIAALDVEMAKSAEKALTNKGANQKGPFGLPPIAGTVVQGVALKAALSVAGSRDL